MTKGLTVVQLLPSSTAQPLQLPLIFQTAEQLPNPFFSIHAFSLSSQLISIQPLCFPVRPFLGDCFPFLTSCPDRDLTLCIASPHRYQDSLWVWQILFERKTVLDGICSGTYSILKNLENARSPKSIP